MPFQKDFLTFIVDGVKVVTRGLFSLLRMKMMVMIMAIMKIMRVGMERVAECVVVVDRNVFRMTLDWIRLGV